jgi:hypothetical protein
MTDTFEHKKRLSEKQFANDSRQAGNETTPKAISEPILAFAKALGGDSAQLVPVKVRDGSTPSPFPSAIVFGAVLQNWSLGYQRRFRMHGMCRVRSGVLTNVNR